MSDDELPIVLDELRTGREPTVVAEFALRRLTARDTEILRALASGEATGEIADELGISPLTAQSYVKSIPAKLCGTPRSRLAVGGASWTRRPARH